jgi:uncharacterized protein (TIGR02145 family)
MKNKLFTILAAATLVACAGEDDLRLKAIPDRENPFFTADAATIDAPKDGTSRTVNITTNTAWEWSAALGSGVATWCTVAPTSGIGDGVITLSISANASADARQTTLTITTGNPALKQVITIAQPGADPIITFDPATVTIASGTGGQQTVGITANCGWTVESSDPEWCSVTPASGSLNGSVTVSVTRNVTTSLTRVATLTFTAGGTLTRSLSVTQEGNAPYHDPNTVTGTTIYFDEFSPNPALTVGALFALTDRRDGQAYKVRLMEDSRYWMIQDLKFALANPEGDAKVTFQATMNGSPKDAVNGYYGDYSNLVAPSGTRPLPAGRGYFYDMTAVIQVREVFGTATRFDRVQGLCPPGWHVPTATVADATGEYNQLSAALANAGEWFAEGKWEGVFAGNTNETASSLYGYNSALSVYNYGGYWSSTINASNASQAYVWRIDGPNAGATANTAYAAVTARHYGFLLRCVANN